MRHRRQVRSSNPLVVASAALTRAIEPAKPSRITVIRLLGDALHVLSESQLTIDAVKSRSSSSVSIRKSQSLNRPQVVNEADYRLRSAHEQGCRALFSAVFSTLLALPCLAGPLRRRAIDILTISGKAAGRTVVLRALDTVRSHINGLKKLSWSESDAADFEVSCAVLTLADLANCTLVGRGISRESITFLLGQRVRQKCKRNELAHALAHIVQSFPVHAPLGDRIIDEILSFCFSSASLKHGTAGFGTALLTAVIVPFLVSRGHAPADEVVAKSAKAMRLSPTPTERSMWALALARASVTARRSTLYQILKYGTPRTPSKSKAGKDEDSASKSSNDVNVNGEDDAPAWISKEDFEEAVSQVSRVTNLSDGSCDAVVSVAAVLRMWAQALPDALPEIIPCVFSKLLPELHSIEAFSSLVDAIWLGVLKHVTPSMSSLLYERLFSTLQEHGLSLAAALHVYADLVEKHGRQAMRETGLTRTFKKTTTGIIEKISETVGDTQPAVRFGSVRLMAAVVDALPRTCSRFLTHVLQNMRFADMSLASTPANSYLPSRSDDRDESDFTKSNISQIMGNAAALSMLIEKLSLPLCNVPNALNDQIFIDTVALLRPHHAREVGVTHDAIALSLRRRAGWGLVAAMARAQRRAAFDSDALNLLLASWKEDLGFAPNKSAAQDASRYCLHQYPVPSMTDMAEAPGNIFDVGIARSSTRASSLCALACALEHVPSGRLEGCARVLVASCASRIVAVLAGHHIPSSSKSAQLRHAQISFSPVEITVTDVDKRKHVSNLMRALTLEAVYLAKCLTFVSPDGEATELCYNVCVALTEEAQRVLGEWDNEHVVDLVLTHGAASQKQLFESTLGKGLSTMYRVSPLPVIERNSFMERIHRSEIARSSSVKKITDKGDYSWIFGTEGLAVPSAEQTFVAAARGVAAVLCENLARSGALVDSSSFATLSPMLSGVLGLEMARRLSHSDLAETNRALTAIQLLARKSLEVSDGCKRSFSSQMRAGKLYTPSRHGDEICLNRVFMPGSRLHEIAQSGSWLSWTRGLSHKEDLSRVPFQNFHTRAFSLMIAGRIIAAEAHRELSVTGGEALWIGMMRKVLSLVRDNMECSSPTQSVLFANSLASVTALLEVIPEKQTSRQKQSKQLANHGVVSDTVTIDRISAEAVDLIARTIESDNSDAQAIASVSLSNCSHRIASSSERILAAISRAWSEEKGDRRSLGQFGRCSDEADLWALCFFNSWSNMCVSDVKNRRRFYCRDSHGLGSLSSAFVAGASAVVSSCRLHWWPLSESSYFTVKEMSAELLQWHGETSMEAHAVGLRGMTAIWATRIDSAQAKHLTIASRHSETWSQGSSTTSVSAQEYLVPIQEFTLKDPSRLKSQTGPFLDDVLYAALAPLDNRDGSLDLQNAACYAIGEMVRGAGAKEVSRNLLRLPETLFAALDAGAEGAGKLLHLFVQQDGIHRPRYWFGLCRAISLNEERLNHGSGSSTWDLSHRTNPYTIHIASQVVQNSLAACPLFGGNQHERNADDPCSRNCAHSFLGKVVDFAKQICKGHSFDFAVCQEACLLLQAIFLQMEGFQGESQREKSVVVNFRECWHSCQVVLQKLLTDEVPQTLLEKSIGAISEGITMELRFQRANIFEFSHRSFESVLRVLDCGIGSALEKRFAYLDQQEDIGLQALLAVIAACARILSALVLSTSRSGPLFEERKENPAVVERLLFPVCGDFVLSLRDFGLKTLAQDGGSLTSRAVSEAALRRAFLAFAPSIILGGVSCSNFLSATHDKTKKASFWINEDSAGVRLSLHQPGDAKIIRAALVWLLSHEHSDPFCKLGLSLPSFQVLESFESACIARQGITGIWREAFAIFSKRNSSSLLAFALRIASLYELGNSCRCFLTNIILTVITTAHDGDVERLEGLDGKSFRSAFLALCQLICGTTDASLREFQSMRSLDIVIALVRCSSSKVVEILATTEVLPSLCDIVFTSTMQCAHLRNMPQICFARCHSVYEMGMQSADPCAASIGATLCARVCTLPFLPRSHFISRMVLTFPYASRQEKTIGLNRLLGCIGVEALFADFVESSTDKVSSHSVMVLHLLSELGGLAVSGYAIHTSKALGCAVAAILADGLCARFVNKAGLLVYAALLSRLIFSIPQIPQKHGRSDYSGPDERYLKSLISNDNSVETLASSMSTEERERTLTFLAGT